MIRLIILAIILGAVFTVAYKIINLLVKSSDDKQQFEDNNPEQVWHSAFKTISGALTIIFIAFSYFLFSETQYILAGLTLILVAITGWVYNKC